MKDKRCFFSIMVFFSIVASALIFSITESALYAEEIEAPPTEEQAIEEKAVEEKAIEEETIERKMVSEEIKPGNITVDFKDADIKTVLRVLSEKSGVNIVAGRGVEGYITIRLSNVHWETALDIICKNYGYAYERDENIIRVTTLENLKQEELTTEVFTLNYAKANEVAEAIKEMLTERGKDKIKYDERTNVLIVTDIPTNIYKIRQVIEKLDAKTPQVLIEAKIIETTLDDDENLGINWTLKFTATGAVRPTTFPFDAAGSKIFGGEKGLRRFLPLGDADDDTGFMSYSRAAFPEAVSTSFTVGTLNFSQFSMVLEYLKSRTDTNIISNPRIATLNNKEASILIGEVINIPTMERNTDTGTMELVGYTPLPLGIGLNVTPHINAQGDIVVDLYPSIKELVGYDILDSVRGIRAPRYTTREAKTQVMVRDADTIMIGGLIKDKTIDYIKKVPFLGDIPGIGKWWFTKTEEALDKTELIIFMTVYLISDVPDTEIAPSTAFVPLSNEKKREK